MKKIWTQKLFRLIGGWLLSGIARGSQKKSKRAPYRTKKRKFPALESKTLPKILRFLINRFRLRAG